MLCKWPSRRHSHELSGHSFKPSQGRQFCMSMEMLGCNLRCLRTLEYLRDFVGPLRSDGNLKTSVNA